MNTNSRHDQTNDGSGNSTISPAALIHTEFLTVTGAARTGNVILGVVGMTNGAQLVVFVDLPVIDGITLNFFSGVVTGPQVATINSDPNNAIRGMLAFSFDDQLSQWDPLLFVLPSI